MNILASSQKLDLIYRATELDDTVILSQSGAIKEKTGTVTLGAAEFRSIERGFDDFKQGKVVSHAQAKKRYEKWL
jgi:predicted transcriptional regulator